MPLIFANAGSRPAIRPRDHYTCLSVESRDPETLEEAEMAVGMLQTAEMFTKEMYDQVTEKMFGHSSPMRPEESPEGLIVHSAGQGEGGWYVYDIWESEEAFQRFMDEKLGPAVREVMGDQQPQPEAAPQFFQIEVLVIPSYAFSDLPCNA